MNPQLTSAPTAEPVSLAEAKAHLRIDHADDDSVIAAQITAARQYCENYTGLAFISQTWTWRLNAWPAALAGLRPGQEDADPSSLFAGGSGRFVRVPRGPLLAVTSITTYDDADVGAVWDAANYYVASGQDRIYRRIGASWPGAARTADSIEIVYVAGFCASAADVPDAIRRAILLTVADLYEHRLATVAEAGQGVPPGLAGLLAPYRSRRV